MLNRSVKPHSTRKNRPAWRARIDATLSIMMTSTLAMIATINDRSKLRARRVSWRKMMSNQVRRHPDSLAGSCSVMGEGGAGRMAGKCLPVCAARRGRGARDRRQWSLIPDFFTS
jgi:hypothetical protein